MDNYTEENIDILEGLEGVRLRPGMYIGDAYEDGLHHMIWEILDNSIDEHLAGYCNKIKVSILKDKSIQIEDNGRGIPVKLHKKANISTATAVFTMLHAGGKFNGGGYKVSGGLHGVGASVVNALSSNLELEIYRDGKIYNQNFKQGNPVKDIVELGNTDKHGTKVTYLADKSIFKCDIEYDEEKILQRLEETSYLNKGLRIEFNSEISNRSKVYVSENGLIDYINKISEKQLYKPLMINGTHEGVEVEIALVHDVNFKQNILSYSNNIHTIEDGTHVVGTMNGFSKAILDESYRTKIKEAEKLSKNDIYEGLYGIISVKLENPELKGQTKGKLNNSEARTATYHVVKNFITNWVDTNEDILKIIIEKAITAKKANEMAKKSREIIERKANINAVSVLPGKLTDCRSKNPEECELFLVEGDSAGGSAKQCRNTQTQAILPLKGKPLNVVKVEQSKALKNDEINAIITSIGCGINNNIDIDKMRYKKIIIMADSDIDGKHIETLLSGLFFVYMKKLIEMGNIYIACPPLFYTVLNKKKYFFLTIDELNKFKEENKNKNYTVQRFKGLGEMNPDQLWDTTMNPETRTLKQLNINDLDVTQQWVKDLLGKEAENRRNFILANDK